MSPSFATVAPEATRPADIRSLVWLVGFSHATNHFVILIFPAVLLLVSQEFGLGYAGAGLLASVALFGYGAGALPAGMLADRFGAERVLAIWLASGSLACVGIGLSAGPPALLVGLAALGLAASLHHPAGSGILVALKRIPGIDLGRAFALSGILGNVGLALAPVVAGTIGAWWGWRAAFLIGAIPGLLLAPPLWLRHPRPSAESVEPSGAPARPRPGLWAAMTLPLLILFSYETLLGFIFQGFSTFLPAYLAEHASIPGLTASRVAKGGSLASLALLFGGLGHWVAGRLMSRARRELTFLAAMSGMTICLLGMGVTGGLPLVLCSILFSFGHFALGTISNTFIALHTPPHAGGTAFGVTFTLALGVGSLASGAMGLVGQQHGLPAVFLVLGLVAVGATLLAGWFGYVVGGWPARRHRTDAAVLSPSRPPAPGR